MKTHHLTLALITGLILAAGCDDPPASADPMVDVAPLQTPRCTSATPIGSSFVRRQGNVLQVDGKPFRALGGNLYYLQQLFAYGEGGRADLAEPAVQGLDQAACMKMTVVRAWAFNNTQDSSTIRPEPGVYREIGLRGLDRVVAEAKARGLRLILALTNNWNDYGGLETMAVWAGKGAGARDEFFTDATMKGYWKDYVTTLANRVNVLTGVAYKDEPTILAWEVGNEFRCQSCVRTTRLVDAVQELARHLKTVMPNHLVADGGEGMDDEPTLYPSLSNKYVVSGFEGASFSKLLGIEELDMVSYHMYPREWSINTGNDVKVWIDAHELLAKLAGKVPYLGEFGYDPGPANDQTLRDRNRATLYDTWLRRLIADNGARLGVVWQVIPEARANSGNDGFGVVSSLHPATAGVLDRWARRMNF